MSVPPDGLGRYLATGPDQRRAEIVSLLAELLGRPELEPQLVEERLYVEGAVCTGRGAAAAVLGS